MSFKSLSLLRSFQHIVQLYTQIELAPFVNMCPYTSLYQSSKWKELRRAIDFLPTLYTTLLCNNCLTLLYLPHVITNISHIAVATAHFVVNYLPHFVIALVPLCNSVKLPFSLLKLAPNWNKVAQLWNICAIL